METSIVSLRPQILRTIPNGMKLPHADDISDLTGIVQVIMFRVRGIKPLGKDVRKDIFEKFQLLCGAATSLLQEFYNSADNYAALLTSLSGQDVVLSNTYASAKYLHSEIHQTLPKIGAFKSDCENFLQLLENTVERGSVIGLIQSALKRLLSLAARLKKTVNGKPSIAGDDTESDSATFRKDASNRDKAQALTEDSNHASYPILQIFNRMDGFWRVQVDFLGRSLDGAPIDLHDVDLHTMKNAWAAYQRDLCSAMDSIRMSKNAIANAPETDRQKFKGIRKRLQARRKSTSPQAASCKAKSESSSWAGPETSSFKNEESLVFCEEPLDQHEV